MQGFTPLDCALGDGQDAGHSAGLRQAALVNQREEAVRRRIRDGQLDAVTSGARWLISAPARDCYLAGDNSSNTAAA